MVCLGNTEIILLSLRCTQVLNFGLLLTMRATPSLVKGLFPRVVDLMVI